MNQWKEVCLMESETNILTEAAAPVTIDKKQALQKYNEYKQALRISRNQHDRMMKAVYQALAQGLGVVNPRAAILKAGLNDKGQPRLAICRADFQTVYFKRSHFEAAYSVYPSRYLTRSLKSAQEARLQFWFGDKTLPDVQPIKKPVYGKDNSLVYYQEIYPPGYRETVKAVVPIVPPAHRPAGAMLSQYSVLWEVAEWEALPKPPVPPGDPMLLKPLGHTGLYAVMAHWDLTDVERMVLGALYGS
jgi:hypothetical protein